MKELVLKIYSEFNQIIGHSLYFCIFIQSGDLFISGNEIVDASDTTYTNVYIFDQAQVTLNNITIIGDIEIYGNATLLMHNGGSANRLFVNEKATVTLDNISGMTGSVVANDNSSLIIVKKSAHF